VFSLPFLPPLDYVFSPPLLPPLDGVFSPPLLPPFDGVFTLPLLPPFVFTLPLLPPFVFTLPLPPFALVVVEVGVEDSFNCNNIINTGCKWDTSVNKYSKLNSKHETIDIVN
jgi:hypothetical protein